jgi:signal transduction histidine kinase
MCAHFDRPGPDIFNAFGAIQDISQVINTENELSMLKSQFEEMTTKQHMVEANTQLAHELNQPLAAINLNINYIRQLIDDAPSNNNKLNDAINDIASDVNRATNVVKNIRRILHKEPVAISKFDLNELIDETIYVFNRELLKKEINLIYDHEDEPCIIRFNKTGLQQVIVNLLKNAIEAIDHGNIDSPMIKVTKEITPGQTNIFICDNGPGIKEENKENIFKQYYTSKKGNTGMGLAICKALMKEIEGDIELIGASNVKKTCFKIIIKT